MTATGRPAPFSVYTTPEFWADPHISARMLTHHLDPDTDASSRRHEFIDRSAEWLFSALQLSDGTRLLDLGSGPGLYAIRLARRGVEVLAVDVAPLLLEHLRAAAAAEDLPVRTLEGSYLEADLGSGHDAAILIHEDYCVLSPSQRAVLLRRVREALRPGGRVAFDVTAAARFDPTEFRREEADLQRGFWVPSPYRGVHERWTYPHLRLMLDRYVIERDGHVREFWNWTHCLTVTEVEEELHAAGFEVEQVVGDAAGGPFDAASPTFAVVARAVG